MESKKSSPPSKPRCQAASHAVVTPPSSKTWASLFKGSPTSGAPAAAAAQVPTAIPSGTLHVSPAEATTSSSKPVAKVGPCAPAEKDQGKSACMRRNHSAVRMAEHLHSYVLDHRTIPLQPRGLVNRGNWCYVNSTLQALVACPPFYNLICSLEALTSMKGADSFTPVIDSMVDFFQHFCPMPKIFRRDRPYRTEEAYLHLGRTFEPTSVHQILTAIKCNFFEVEGEQQDAEEFLSCLLNGLQDEMTELMNAVGQPSGPAQPIPSPSASQTGSRLSCVSVETNAATTTTTPSTGEVWEGQRQRHEVLPDPRGVEQAGRSQGDRTSITRKTELYRTPMSEMFMGQIRSTIHRDGELPTANLQPFFTLQLDIQDDRVRSIREALEGLVCPEVIEGYTCAKTHQEVEAFRQITLEALPRVLILHLKRFVYNKLGGSQKLMKQISFGVDMEITRNVLSPAARAKLSHKQRNYKLFAVVYHDGKESNRGHYVTDAYNAGCGSWLRFDDSLVRTISEAQLLKYNPPRVPYLLYYLRDDTLAPLASPSPSPSSSSDTCRYRLRSDSPYPRQ